MTEIIASEPAVAIRGYLNTTAIVTQLGFGFTGFGLGSDQNEAIRKKRRQMRTYRWLLFIGDGHQRRLGSGL